VDLSRKKQFQFPEHVPSLIEIRILRSFALAKKDALLSFKSELFYWKSNKLVLGGAER
jgi:hypothetical protein